MVSFLFTLRPGVFVCAESLFSILLEERLDCFSDFLFCRLFALFLPRDLKLFWLPFVWFMALAADDYGWSCVVSVEPPV